MIKDDTKTVMDTKNICCQILLRQYFYFAGRETRSCDRVVVTQGLHEPPPHTRTALIIGGV